VFENFRQLIQIMSADEEINQIINNQIIYRHYRDVIETE